MIWFLIGLIFGISDITVISILFRWYPLFFIKSKQCVIISRLSKSLLFGSSSGKEFPISPSDNAPKIESAKECKITSPSDIASIPNSNGNFTPPKTIEFPSQNLCKSNPFPIRISSFTKSSWKVIFIFFCDPSIKFTLCPESVSYTHLTLPTMAIV